MTSSSTARPGRSPCSGSRTTGATRCRPRRPCADRAADVCRPTSSSKKFDQLCAYRLFVQFFGRGRECAFDPPAELNISSVTEGYLHFLDGTKPKLFHAEIGPSE